MASNRQNSRHGKSNSSGANTGGGKSRGPRHGHGNKGRGGGTNANSGNPTGMTIAEAMDIYGVDNKADLQQRMKTNPANTVGFYNLLEPEPETTTTTNTPANTVTTFTNNDLNNLYNSILGRDVKKEGIDYWQDQYTKATEGGKSSANAIKGIKDSILASTERSDLGLGTTLEDPNAARHRVAAFKSIAKGDGVRAGTVASYNDKFNADGTVKDDWVDEATWNQNRIAAGDARIKELENREPEIKTITKYIDRWNDIDTSVYDSQIADLKATIAGQTEDYESLMQDYKTQKAGYDSLYAQAAYGERPRNLTVKGVRTRNELPGYKPRTSGTGFFSRGRRNWGLGAGLAAGGGLSISGLNI